MLDLSAARIISMREPKAVKPDTATVQKAPDAGLAFRVSGKTRARGHWLIPVNFRLPVTAKLEFSVEAVNVAAIGEAGNLYLLLQRLPGKAGPPQKIIPAFTALGREGKERGNLVVDLADETYFLHSIHVDLFVDDPGDASLQLRNMTLSFTGNPVSQEDRDRILARSPSVKVEVRSGPTWLINGKPLTAIAGLAGSAEMKLKPAQGKLLAAGLQVNRLSVPLGGPRSLWSYPGYFDVPRLKQGLSRVCLDGSWVILDVDLSQPPPWWTPPPGSGLSDFNPAWRTYCQQALARLLTEIRRSPWDPCVIGISLQLGPQRNLTALPNRAGQPQYTTAFRQWLTAEHGDDAALQKAWQDPDVTLATAVPEPPAQWAVKRLGLLRHPQASRRDLDSWAFWNQSWLDFQLFLAKFIKDKTKDQYLCGFANGPANFLARLQLSRFSLSYRTLTRLLTSPDIDFLELSMTAAELDAAAGSYATQFPVSRLLQKHRKRLILRVPSTLFYPKEKETPDLDRLRHLQVQLLAVDAGVVFDDFDLAALEQPALLRTLGNLKTWANCLPQSPARKAEIAFVIDPQTVAEIPPDLNQALLPAELADDDALAKRSGNQRADLLQVPRRDWQRIGAPYDIVLIDELDPEPYRLLIFFHTIRMTPERRKRIEQAQAGGRTLVWLWADGLFHESRVALNRMSKVIGMELKLSMTAQRLFQTPDKSLARLLHVTTLADTLGARVLPGDEKRIADVGYAPSFVISDDKARVLALNADTRQPAMALRQFDDWTAVYSAAPALNPEVIRGLAAKAGVALILNTNDQLFPIGPFIGVHTRTAGKRTLHVAAEEALYEIFHQRALSPAREHTIELKENQTYLFFRGGKEKWDAAVDSAMSGKP